MENPSSSAESLAPPVYCARVAMPAPLKSVSRKTLPIAVDEWSPHVSLRNDNVRIKLKVHQKEAELHLLHSLKLGKPFVASRVRGQLAFNTRTIRRPSGHASYLPSFSAVTVGTDSTPRRMTH